MKIEHTNTGEQLREFRKLLVKFNERMLQLVEGDPALIKRWNLHTPENVKNLRRELARRAKVAAYQPEERLKHYRETGEKRAPDWNQVRIAVFAAIIQYHNDLIFQDITGDDPWDL